MPGPVMSSMNGPRDTFTMYLNKITMRETTKYRRVTTKTVYPSLFLANLVQGSVGSAVHEYKFPPQMLDVLPEADRAWRFRTCAVVGNSGMLLKVRLPARPVTSDENLC